MKKYLTGLIRWIKKSLKLIPDVKNIAGDKMKIKLIRYKSNANETLGKLYIDWEFICYTLEDEKRAVKLWGETRIPAGSYELKLNTEVGKNQKYKIRFPEMHKGMIEVTKVPNFKYILIHIGNTDKDTAGCILVGSTVNDSGKKWSIGRSADAYKLVYEIISNELYMNKKVVLSIHDED